MANPNTHVPLLDDLRPKFPRTVEQLRESIAIGAGGAFFARAFGAVGDGVTDDTSAIQAALDAARDAGGGIVQLESTRYFIATGLTIYPYTTLQGHGQSLTAFKGTELFTNSDIVLLSSPTVSSDINENILIRDMQIRNVMVGAKTKYEVDLVNPIGCKLDNVWLFVSVLTTSDTGGIRFRKLGSPASGPFINHVQNSLVQQASVIFENVSDSYVVNSFVWGHTRPHCIFFDGVGGGVHGSELIGSPTNGSVYGKNTTGGLIIDGNFFDGSSPGVNTGRAVNFLNVNNSMLIGNRVSNHSSDSFYFEDCTHTSVVGNAFRNNNKNDDGSDDIHFNSVTKACVANTIIANTFQQSNTKTTPGKCILIEDNGAASTNNVVALNSATPTNYVASTITGGSTSTIFENRGTGLVNLVTFAQTSFKSPVAVGGVAGPNAAALLDLDNTTTQGFLPPRMTSAQMGAIGSPPTGLLVFNTTAGVLSFFNGTAWVAV